MRIVILFFLILITSKSFGQEEEKLHTFYAGGAFGLGFTNYYFNSNSPAAPYAAPEVNEAVILSIPFKLTLLYHHPIMNVGNGLDERKINIGIGLKRHGLSGSYYDYDTLDYVTINTSMYKFTGRAELILIQHERGTNVSGFGILLEGGSLIVRSPIGKNPSRGFTGSIGGFYFFQLMDHLSLYLEASEGYDRFKTLINKQISTHSLYTTDILVGIRVKI